MTLLANSVGIFLPPFDGYRVECRLAQRVTDIPSVICSSYSDEAN